MDSSSTVDGASDTNDDRRPLVESAVNVVSACVAGGVDIAFTVPGESFLAVLDALHDEPRIRTIATRHEGGAAFMADAYAKVLRRPALCMGTRAVGAANLAIGIHNAQQDSVPMLAIVGQVSSTARHRESFQETELSQFLGPITKWAIEPTDPHEIGRLTYRSLTTAVSGRPGPVAVATREDVITIPVPKEHYPPVTPSVPVASDEEVKAVAVLLRDAKRPLLLVGGDLIGAEGAEAAVELAELVSTGVVALWRRPDAFPNDHPQYLGHAGLSSPPSVRATLAESDLWIVVGGRLDENTLDGYTLPSEPTSVVHVGTDSAALDARGGGRAIVSDAVQFMRNLIQEARQNPANGEVQAQRRDWVARTRAVWEEQTTPSPQRVRPGYADQFTIAAIMRERLSPDTVIVVDAGNFSGWNARFYRWTQPFTFVGSGAGAMGYAVPGAIGAQLALPDRPVVGLAGDGGFLMTASELQTAARERLPIVYVVFHNGQYGTIRMHQERTYPGRPIATEIGEVDFVGLARSLGCRSELVDTADDFGPALDRALESDEPYVIVVRTDPEQISVNTVRS